MPLVNHEPISILETAELRWFVHGPIPCDLADWFTSGGGHGSTQRRTDSYRIEGCESVGVKKRFEDTVELKQRCWVDAPLDLEHRLAARVEHWRKWSPALGMVERHHDERWVRVHKSITKRRFSPAGIELPVTPSLPLVGGCDIEIVTLEVDGLNAWSLALSSFGPWKLRTRNLSAAWRGLVETAGKPGRVDIPIEAASGYPAWLSQLAEYGLVASADTAAA